MSPTKQSIGILKYDCLIIVGLSAIDKYFTFIKGYGV